MFNNSRSVISNISRSVKKYLFILGILTHVIFIAYYIYLICTHLDTLYLVILYSLVLTLAISLLVIDICTIDITDFNAKSLKKNSKRIIHIFSWLCKLAVIIYNIYVTVRYGSTDANRMFLIFSSIFLIIQILSFFFGWLFSYYSELFLYALKMDYENLIDEKEDPNEKPIGKALNKLTNQLDHKDKINELTIKHELYGSIKDELEKDNEIKVNGKVLKRKKVEKIILHYYKKANKYYSNQKKYQELLSEIKENLEQYLLVEDKAYLLEFYLRNHYEGLYVGLSEYAIKLIIAGFLFMIDNSSRIETMHVIYNALIKEIIDIKTWSVANSNRDIQKEDVYNVNRDIKRAIEIAKETKTQYELYKDETITSELESLILKIVKDSVIENGKLVIKRKIHNFFFRKDKND